jgi:hypothetical protein
LEDDRVAIDIRSDGEQLCLSAEMSDHQRAIPQNANWNRESAPDKCRPRFA